MNVTLYKYLSERNRVDKSAFLSVVTTATGEFKADVSILTPTLLLTLPTEGTEQITDEGGNLIDGVVIGDDTGEVLDFNYIYIEEFRRYYFVNSIIVLSGGLLTITGEVDPLYSFKDEILNNSAMIERNEFSFDPLLEDNIYPLSNVKDVEESDIVPGEYANFEFQTDMKPQQPAQVDNDFNIVVNLATIVSGTQRHNVTPPAVLSDLNKISGAHFYSLGSGHFVVSIRDAYYILQAIRGEQSLYSSYLNSMIAFPFLIPYNEDLQRLQIQIGDGSFVEIGRPETAQGFLTEDVSPYLILCDFQLPAVSSFLDLPPYKHYEIFIPFYGWYELPLNSEIAEDHITLYYSAHWEDGSGEVYLYDRDKKRMIFTAPCQLGVKIALNATNAYEIEAQKNANFGNLILGITSSIVGVATSVASSNPVGVVGSLMGGVASVQQYNNREAQLFVKTSASNNGASGGFYSYLKARAKVTRAATPTDFDVSEYAHQYGRPLRAVKRLGDLSGFTQVSKIHLEQCAATDREKEIIESSLLAGVQL